MKRFVFFRFTLYGYFVRVYNDDTYHIIPAASKYQSLLVYWKKLGYINQFCFKKSDKP